ncbi:MAG: flagellar biosynthesis protein FlgN [Treponema sp.]|nr:flagellar biosynthesis protein FlgN [Treponema sp.]
MVLTMPAQSISAAELQQRVAVIKRFRELLRAQRDRFQVYLNTLDRQKDIIENGNADDLIRHVEMEEKIVEDIFSIQKVIDPLELMYNSTKKDDEVSNLKDVLEGLKSEAITRSARNRDMLAKRMVEIRSEIKSLKTNAYTRRNFDSGPKPTVVDISG